MQSIFEQLAITQPDREQVIHLLTGMAVTLAISLLLKLGVYTVKYVRRPYDPFAQKLIDSLTANDAESRWHLSLNHRNEPGMLCSAHNGNIRINLNWFDSWDDVVQLVTIRPNSYDKECKSALSILSKRDVKAIYAAALPLLKRMGEKRKADDFASLRKKFDEVKV